MKLSVALLPVLLGAASASGINQLVVKPPAPAEISVCFKELNQRG